MCFTYWMKISITTHAFRDTDTMTTATGRLVTASERGSVRAPVESRKGTVGRNANLRTGVGTRYRGAVDSVDQNTFRRIISSTLVGREGIPTNMRLKF